MIPVDYFIENKLIGKTIDFYLKMEKTSILTKFVELVPETSNRQEFLLPELKNISNTRTFKNYFQKEYNVKQRKGNEREYEEGNIYSIWLYICLRESYYRIRN